MLPTTFSQAVRPLNTLAIHGRGAADDGWDNVPASRIFPSASTAQKARRSGITSTYMKLPQSPPYCLIIRCDFAKSRAKLKIASALDCYCQVTKCRRGVAALIINRPFGIGASRNDRTIGISWFEAKTSIIREAVRNYIANPLCVLLPTA